jgi:hypothetical protein
MTFEEGVRGLTLDYGIPPEHLEQLMSYIKVRYEWYIAGEEWGKDVQAKHWRILNNMARAAFEQHKIIMEYQPKNV